MILDPVVYKNSVLNNGFMLAVVFVCFCFVFFDNSAQAAEDHESGVNVLFGVGLTFGGERLATAEFSDGTTSDIDTGDLIHIYTGLSYAFPDSAYRGQLTFGYHFDSVSDRNNSVGFDRYPVELLIFRKNERFRFGAGLSYHLDPTLDQSDFGDPDVTFENALGTVFQAGFQLLPYAWLDFRYVFIDYELKQIGSSSASGDISGDHFGLYVSLEL